jgi:hypothetical protein
MCPDIDIDIDIDAAVAGLRAHGAELVGEVAQYQDSHRLCYVRGPAEIIVASARSCADGMSPPTCDQPRDPLDRTATTTGEPPCNRTRSPRS